MTGALVILLVTVFVGLLLYVSDRRVRRKSATAHTDGESASEEEHGAICCGRHVVCEKSLSPLPGEEIVYYDDEELDRFAGREDDSYTAGEIEEFREVMMTLLPEDVAGWARSIQLRGITLPVALRDELFMILED